MRARGGGTIGVAMLWGPAGGRSSHHQSGRHGPPPSYGLLRSTTLKALGHNPWPQREIRCVPTFGLHLQRGHHSSTWPPVVNMATQLR